MGVPARNYTAKPRTEMHFPLFPLVAGLSFWVSESPPLFFDAGRQEGLSLAGFVGRMPQSFSPNIPTHRPPPLALRMHGLSTFFFPFQKGTVFSSRTCARQFLPLGCSPPSGVLAGLNQLSPRQRWMALLLFFFPSSESKPKTLEVTLPPCQSIQRFPSLSAGLPFGRIAPVDLDWCRP